MKRWIALVLILGIFLSINSSAFAKILQMDISTATDAELKSVIQMIQTEQAIRYKNNLAHQAIDADADGLSFRNLPWFSTLENVENAIGQVSKYRSADDLYRLSYTNYKGVSSGNDRVDGELGCTISYNGLNVAGYTPSSTRICYIFPIVEGQIVREFELAQMYMGYYEFEDEDCGDLVSIYEDLAAKLEKLYGEGKKSSDENFTNAVWQDVDGNKVRLQVNGKATYLTLAYVAAAADNRLDEMAEAFTLEKAQAENAIRQENINNTDGL